jgi:hypothetical protein
MLPAPVPRPAPPAGSGVPAPPAAADFASVPIPFGHSFLRGAAAVDDDLPTLSFRGAAAAANGAASGAGAASLGPSNRAGGATQSAASAISVVDGRGRHPRVGCATRKKFGVYAFEHLEKVNAGMGEICDPKNCPTNGRCRNTLTLNDYKACHEYSYGSVTKGRRDAETNDVVASECSCELKSNDAHGKWAELILKCFTRKAGDDEVNVLFHVGATSAVCGEAMRNAYGINKTFWSGLLIFGRCAES